METSIEDLSEILEENNLEITRNPFDSQLYDKENFPLLDASVFLNPSTPQRQSTGGFRWSIDQIALLKPAEMELFPNQEYSVTYDKKEDEERDQQQVDEYFRNVLLPSPWLENHADILKRVTFSPNPPATRYITDQTDNSCNSSYSQSVLKMNISTADDTLLADACCQTVLTFPVDFNLETLIDNQFFTYSEELDEGKELLVSSLRRKLFVHEPKIPLTEGNNVSLRLTPSYTTSSPTKESTSRKQTLPITPNEDENTSPAISPLESMSTGSTLSVFGSSTDSPKQASNVGTPQHMRTEVSFSSVDVSPIQSGKLKGDTDVSTYSFLPDVSIDLNGTEEEIRESSRDVRFNSPDISPIKYDNVPSVQTTNTGMDSSELQENGQQNIKESTARNIHAFTGFDISSINDHSSRVRDSVDLQSEDTGPLDITELLSVDHPGSNGERVDDDKVLGVDDLENAISCVEAKVHKSTDSKSSSESCQSFSGKETSDPFIISPSYSHITPDSCNTTPLKGILKHRGTITPTPTNFEAFNREEDTRFNTACNSGKRLPCPVFTQIMKSSGENNPLTSGNSGLPRPVLKEKVMNNVVSNSNDTPGLEIGVWRRAGSLDDVTLHEDVVSMRANAALRRARKFTNSFEREFPDKENFPLSSFRRAAPLNSTEVTNNKENVPLSSFRRAAPLNSTEVTNNKENVPLSSFQRAAPLNSTEVTNNKENFPLSSFRRAAPLNSTEVTSNYSGMTGSGADMTCSSGSDKMFASDIIVEERQTDSGVSSMEWSNTNKIDEKSIPSIRSISPLLRLDQLSLTNKKNWSFQKKSSSSVMNRSSSQSSRLMLYRSFTWPHNQRIRSPATFNAALPRSRVAPKYRTRRTPVNYKIQRKQFDGYEGFDEFKTMKSAYKDLLQSPLK